MSEPVSRMYAGALASVSDRVAWRKLCTAAAGVGEEEYATLTFEQKEAVIRKGRRAIERAERKGEAR